MGDKKTTETSPEKKLLEIIEQGQSAAAVAQGGVQSAHVKALKQKKLFSLPAIQSAIANGMRFLNANALAMAKKALELKRINQGLLIFSVALVFVLVSFLGNYRRGSAQLIELSLGDIKKINEKEMQLLSKNTPGPLDGVLGKIVDRTKKRDLFKSAKQEKQAAVEQAIPKGTELLKNLKLVGISYANDPSDTYAMIEDVASKTTYFMKTEETLLGAKIKTIERDRVVLLYMGNPIELR